MSDTSTPSPQLFTPGGISRRRFLEAGAAAAALSMLPWPARLATAKECSALVPDEKISIQLWTCLVASNLSMEATLERLAAIGYQRVEHAGYGSAGDAKGFRAALDAAGIKCNTGHTPIPHPYDDAAWKQAIEDALIVGQEFIVAASKSGGGNTEKDWRAYSKTMNKAGAIAAKAGIRHIGHHCHGGEWEPVDDNEDLRPIDIMMSDTDPDLVHVQMDIGWCYSVTDPIAELKKFPGRFWQVHVKDMRAGAPTFPGYGEIGAEGFARIFGAAKETRQPINDFIVEQDAAPTGFESAQMGWDLLHGMEYTYKCK
jgi:sugar phosphate isomerase/epimerase